MTDKKDTGIRLKAPDVFDGNQRKARGFLRQIKQYLSVEEASFKGDEHKIKWAQSYMQAGEAAKWVDYVWDRYLDEDRVKDENGVTETITWRKWINLFTNRFMSSNIVLDARADLKGLRQSGKTVEEFNSEFRILVSDAQLFEDGALIEYYKTGLTREARKRVIALDPLPDTLDKWMNKAAQMDKQERQDEKLSQSYRQSSSQNRFGRYNNNRFNNKDRFNKDKSKTRAMKLSDEELAKRKREGLCFNCNKPGHMQNQCPTKKPLQNRSNRTQNDSDSDEEEAKEASDKDESESEDEVKDVKEETRKFLRKIGVTSATIQEIVEEEDF